MLTSGQSVRETLVTAASGRPRKACGHCKSQKVRCSGDRPICKRCSRLKHNCIYTTGLTQSPKQPHVRTGAATSRGLSGANSTALTPSKETPRTRVAPSLAPSVPDYLGIPASLIPELITVFYSHSYNASLLLHKGLFLKELAEGSVSGHVLLSICAIASNFYRDAKGNTSLLEHGFGIEWAERASKLVFQDVESPTEDNLVTFLNLTLFWYGQGSWRRAFIHKGNAVQTAYLLGLGNERKGEVDSFRAETRRRRYWACYLVNCHAAESLFVHEPSESTLNLPLPWPEKEFEDGISRSKVVSLGSGQSNNGVFCELIRAMTFWSQVHSLINSPESSTETRITAIHSVDDQISAWWSSINSSFHLTQKNTSDMDINIFPKVLLINIVYHQCLCALHTSIVPLFSWSEGDYTWLSARQLSAQIAYEHAGAASSLLESTIANMPDTSSIPSFVGYAAYCGCATQIPFLWCSETAVRERAQTKFRTNVKMIRILAKHWKFCALLEIHAEYLYQKHAQNPVVLENEPKYLDASKLNVPRIKARHARASILGHNKILWAADTGYARRGEEVKDLGNGSDEEVIRDELAAQTANAPATFQYAPDIQEPVQTDQSRLPFVDQSMMDLFPLDVDYTDMPLFNLDFFDFSDGGNLAGGLAGALDGLPFRM